MGARERTDLLELLDDRVGIRATLITSQLPVEHWHDYLGDPTLADAILDRLVHSAHKLHLEGESMRKTALTVRVFESLLANYGTGRLAIARRTGAET